MGRGEQLDYPGGETNGQSDVPNGRVCKRTWCSKGKLEDTHKIYLNDSVFLILGNHR